jgi:beta-glucosidase
MEYKAGAIWGGYQAPWDKIVYAITIGQQYLMENTTLGIPAIMQSEGKITLSYRTFQRFLRDLQAFMGSRIMGQYGHPRSVLPHLSTLRCCKRLLARLPQKQKGWVILSYSLLFLTCPASFDGVEWKRIMVKTLSCTSLPSPRSYGHRHVIRTSQMGHAYVTGVQSGRRRNVSDTAIARVAATCKHFTAYGSPQGGL